MNFYSTLVNSTKANKYPQQRYTIDNIPVSDQSANYDDLIIENFDIARKFLQEAKTDREMANRMEELIKTL